MAAGEWERLHTSASEEGEKKATKIEMGIANELRGNVSVGAHLDSLGRFWCFLLMCMVHFLRFLSCRLTLIAWMSPAPRELRFKYSEVLWDSVKLLPAEKWDSVGRLKTTFLLLEMTVDKLAEEKQN